MAEKTAVAAHIADTVLRDLHRNLYPENYPGWDIEQDGPCLEWDSGTIEWVAERIGHYIRATSREEVATISYAAEAHDSAAAGFRRLVGYCVTVELASGRTFDAAIREIETDEHGEFVAVLQQWNDTDADAAGPIERHAIYGDIVSVVVA